MVCNKEIEFSMSQWCLTMSNWNKGPLQPDSKSWGPVCCLFNGIYLSEQEGCFPAPTISQTLSHRMLDIARAVLSHWFCSWFSQTGFWGIIKRLQFSTLVVSGSRLCFLQMIFWEINRQIGARTAPIYCGEAITKHESEDVNLQSHYRGRGMNKKTKKAWTLLT